MKNIWICEVCGKEFDNEKDCAIHEEEHMKAKMEKEIEEQNQKESLKNLTNLYKKYLKAIEEHEEKYGQIFMYSTFEDLIRPFSGLRLGRGRRNGWYV